MDRDSKRDQSASQSKKRNNSQLMSKNTALPSKQNQIQQLLMSFYQKNATNSRTDYSSALAKAGEKSRSKVTGGSISTNTTTKNQNISGNANQHHHQQVVNSQYQIYQNLPPGGSTGSKGAKAKARVKPTSKMSGGLIPRGNTIDSRFGPISSHQPSTSIVTNPISSIAGIGSNTTSIGVNSQNQSRPGSAVKPKQQSSSNGMSPTNFQKMMQSKGQNDYKNLLLFKGAGPKKEMSNITNIPQSRATLPKDKNINSIVHKKTNSASVKQATRNKPKLGPPSKLEYNSVAMESILQQQIDSQMLDGQYYQTFHDTEIELNSQMNKRLNGGGSSSKPRQKSTSKTGTVKALPNNASKRDQLKQSTGTRISSGAQDLSKSSILYSLQKQISTASLKS